MVATMLSTVSYVHVGAGVASPQPTVPPAAIRTRTRGWVPPARVTTPPERVNPRSAGSSRMKQSTLSATVSRMLSALSGE